MTDLFSGSDLERELATEAASSDVECCCLREEREGVMWYDLNSADEKDKDWLARAVRYLEWRGLIERNGNWIKINEARAA